MSNSLKKLLIIGSIVASLMAVVVLNFGGRIRYEIFRLGGSQFSLGTFNIKLKEGWMLESTDVGSNDVAAIAVRQDARDARYGSNALIFRLVKAGNFPKNISGAPKSNYSWGSVFLVSPDDALSGISAKPAEHGLAVVDGSLTIEYFSLADLENIESISKHRE